MIASRAITDSIEMVDVADMTTKIQSGPMSIAVAAGNNCWRYYESGILSKDNNCPTDLDHGVVVVGLNAQPENGDKPHWIIQNSWGESWGQKGFIHIAVEDGEGTSAMNTHVEIMNVEEGYPKKADPTENCDHDETQNELGPFKCTSNDQCRGARTCSEWGWCQGDDFCDDEGEDEDEGEDDDISPDPQPDICMVDEDINIMGPGMCVDDSQCKGERVCSLDYYQCVGYSNCPDDREEDHEDKCMINELIFPEGPHRCTHSMHCKGERTCGADGMCDGYCNCP